MKIPRDGVEDPLLYEIMHLKQKGGNDYLGRCLRRGS